MARKWIINDEDLILGDVEFHEELVCKGRDKEKTVGGGRWHYDRDANIIYFWGKSVDFGQATEKEFINAFKQPSVEQATIVFSLKLDFKDVLKEYEEKCNKTE
jgi:hypothetical protein